jgi:hypothetical protein
MARLIAMHDPNEHAVIDAALDELRREYATLPRCDPAAHQQWERDVGRWLLRLHSEEDFARWVVTLAAQMHQVHGGVALEFCMSFVAATAETVRGKVHAD